MQPQTIPAAKCQIFRPETDQQSCCCSECWISIAKSLERIADALSPQPVEIVDGPFVAACLGVTATRVAQMARDNCIPAKCIVPGSGDGKPWKFYREKIMDWIAAR